MRVAHDNHASTNRIQHVDCDGRPPAQRSRDEVEVRLRDLRVELDRAVDRRDVWKRNEAHWVTTCNDIADRLQPLAARQASLLSTNRNAVTAGMIGTGLLGVGLGLVSFSPLIGLAFTLVDAAVIGISARVLERTKTQLRTVTPEANRLYREWEQGRDSIELSRTEQGKVQQQVDQIQGQILGCEMAKALNAAQKAQPAVKHEEHCVVIGGLKVPKRPSTSMGVFG